MSNEEKKVKVDVRNNHLIVREMIMHENSLINYRMGWMTAVHTVLLAVTLSRLVGEDFKLIMPLTGVFVSLMTCWGIFAAQTAINRLQKWWAANSVDIQDLPPVIGYSHTSKIMQQTTPAFLVPCAFFVAWGYVLVKYANLI